MLRASISKFKDHEENRFYLFNIEDEEIRYSFPLNTVELMIFSDALEACIYQGVKDMQLEMYKFSVNDRKKSITIGFISQQPMMNFKLQKAEIVGVLNNMKKLLREENLS